MRRHQVRVNRRRPTQKSIDVKSKKPCYWCGSAMNDKRDHEFQISREHLSNSYNQIVMACRTCNQHRGHDRWVPYNKIAFYRGLLPTTQAMRIYDVYGDNPPFKTGELVADRAAVSIAVVSDMVDRSLERRAENAPKGKESKAKQGKV